MARCVCVIFHMEQKVQMATGGSLSLSITFTRGGGGGCRVCACKRTQVGGRRGLKEEEEEEEELHCIALRCTFFGAVCDLLFPPPPPLLF